MSAPGRIDAPWLGAPATSAVMGALGGRAYFVGGCVRNALMGREATDIDLATPLEPEAVVAALERAGLKAVPTGIEHGTVTAVSRGRGFEITTFRADVETDGRRAVVRFTTEMAEDARRRDFTMNALYADAGGSVHDPLGGLDDLRAGRVRFIGRAEDRIREDYLRILRFFRFSAWYSGAGLDAAGLSASAALAGGLAGLARERIGVEMRKLLAAPDPRAALAAMARTGVLALCLPGAAADRLDPLVEAERAAGAAPDWRRRLAALAPESPREALRLSKAEDRALAAISALAERDEPAAVLAERGGAEAARSAVLIRSARAGRPVPDDLEAALDRGVAAEFPLSAADLVAAGVPRGPALGRALEAAREAWRAANLRASDAALVAAALEAGQQG